MLFYPIRCLSVILIFDQRTALLSGCWDSHFGVLKYVLPSIANRNGLGLLIITDGDLDLTN